MRHALACAQVFVFVYVHCLFVLKSVALYVFDAWRGQKVKISDDG